MSSDWLSKVESFAAEALTALEPLAESVPAVAPFKPFVRLGVAAAVQFLQAQARHAEAVSAAVTIAPATGTPAPAGLASGAADDPVHMKLVP